MNNNPTESTAPGQFLRVVRKTPRWGERLMAMRNLVVSLFGLKNLGGMSQIMTLESAQISRPNTYCPRICNRSSESIKSAK